MTVFDVRCDICGTALLGPSLDDDETGPYGIRFLYHPGDPARRDDSGLACGPCWAGLVEWLGPDRAGGRCARCGEAVEADRSLYFQRSGEMLAWQLCKGHAVEFLNGLRTVQPKIDPAEFTLAGDWSPGGE